MDWSALDDAIGRLLLNPNERVLYPTVAEINQRKAKLSRLSGQLLAEAMESCCDLSDLEPLVDIIRKRFN